MKNQERKPKLLRLPDGWARYNMIVVDQILKGHWEHWLYMELCSHRWINERKNSPITFSAKTLAEMYVDAHGGSVRYTRKAINGARLALARKGVIAKGKGRRLGGKFPHCLIRLTDGLAAKKRLEALGFSAWDYCRQRIHRAAVAAPCPIQGTLIP